MVKTMTPNKLALTLVAVASLNLVACDGGDTETIGAEGGTVASRDGKIELSIPPNALSSDVEVSIEAVDDCDGALACYEIAPFGAMLEVPANVTYFYGEHDMSQANVGDLGLVVDRGDHWSRLADRDLDHEIEAVSASVTFLGRVAVTIRQ